MPFLNKFGKLDDLQCGLKHYQPPGAGDYHPYPQQMAAFPTLDPKTLEVFKKNWEYYCRNPQEMENLRVRDPTRHTNLFR